MSMNVRFLKGTQAKLNSLTSYIEGAFYITDEDRLYFAKNNSELAYLNKSITAVANTTELFAIAKPIPGEFYYVKDGNILCYYSATAETGEPNVGNKGNWIQVNVNTDTDTIVSGIEVSDAKLTTDGKALEMTCTITRTDIDGTELEDLTSTFKITGEQINSFVEKVTVDVSIGSAADSTVIALGGQGTGSVELKAGTNVSLDGSVKDEIVIHAVDTTYGLSNVRKDQSNASAEVILKDNNGTETAVAFEAGTSNDDIEVSAAAGKIIVSHKEYDSITPSEGDSSINAGKFKAITGITTANGHITGVEESEFTLPDDVYASGVGVDANGKITVTLNNGTSVVSGQDLYYTIADENDAEQKYYNQASLTEAIKSLIQNNFTSIVDAMTFKGAIATSAELEAKTPAKGDVYIVKGIITKSEANKLEEDVSSGDIIIANGTETDGVITSNLEWIVVPGFEVDTTYTLSTAGNAIHLKDNDGNDAGTIALEDDDVVLLTSEEANSTYTIKAEHAQITKNNTSVENALDYSEEFSAITGVTYNDYGHVSGVETTKFTIPAFVDQTHTLANDGKTTELKDATGTVRGKFNIENELDDQGAKAGPITVVAVENSDKNGTDYNVKHDKVTVSKPNAEDKAVAPGEKITVVTFVGDDGYGHLTSVNTTKYQLPGQNKLGCEIASVTGGASLTHQLKDANDTVLSFVTDKYISENENLTIAANANHEIKFNLVWGEF